MKNIDLRKRNRGACLLGVGKERFNFDSKSEFVKYKFLCCETMKISEWKKCREYSYSYYEWSQEIKNRFAKYNVRQLAEFEKYLELCIRKKTILSDSSNIIYAALIATALTILFSEVVVNYLGDNMFQWWIWIIFIAVVMLIVHLIITPINRNSLWKNFFSDYKEIIHQILAEKKLE